MLFLPEEDAIGGKVSLELSSPNPGYDPVSLNFLLDEAQIFSRKSSENCEKIVERRLKECSSGLEKVGTEKSHFQAKVIF